MTPPFRETSEALHTIARPHLQGEKRGGRLYLRTDSRIVFVCGANSSGTKPSKREIFLKYARKRLKHFLFFRAEDVFQSLALKNKHDLLTSEDNLANYSDCILLFCESPSSFAELGAFALRDSLAKRLLVVNDKRFHKTRSFVNLGPISKADAQSDFRPAIFADFRSVLRSGTELEDRLNRIPHARRTRLSLEQFRHFSQLKPKKHRLFLIADLIALLGPVTEVELAQALKVLFEDDYIDLSTELALGCQLDIITQARCHKKRTYFLHSLTPLARGPFIDFSYIDRGKLRAQVLRFYYHYDKMRLALLSRKHECNG